nr:MAG TPA: hypothetical protein [Caudoviricetes sp.]
MQEPLYSLSWHDNHLGRANASHLHRVLLRLTLACRARPLV